MINSMINNNANTGIDEISNMINDIPTVRNMESYNGNDVPNQFTITGKGWEMFQSYRSPIALIKGGKVYLFKNWNYSRTTGKYRNRFLGETQAETQKKLESGEYIAVDFTV